MKAIAEAAMDQALEDAQLSKAGLFLMMHPGALPGEGRGVFEYAVHEDGSDIPNVKARANVDPFTGDVQAEASAVGWRPWSPQS